MNSSVLSLENRDLNVIREDLYDDESRLTIFGCKATNERNRLSRVSRFEMKIGKLLEPPLIIYYS